MTTHHVLILGEPSDPMVLQWRDYCENAGHQATLFLDMDSEETAPPDTPYSILLNTHIQLPFFHLEHLPDHLYDELADDCLYLVNCLSETPTSIGAGIDEASHIVGFSAIGLYTGNKVLEITRAQQTEAKYLQKAQHFLDSLGMQAIEVPETPGLVLGRILAMLANEAASALMEGVASPQDIDTAMQLGTNYPHGPLAWADLVGLDVILAILQHLLDEYGEERYAAMTLLKRKVEAGKLGRKSGEGFYSYHPEALMRS